MKKHLFILLVICGALNAQPPRSFYATYGGTGEDIAYGVKEAYSMHYGIIGSTASFGYGNNDMYLILIDSLGRGIWQKSYGGPGNEIGKSLVYNPADSGFVLVGYSNSYGNGGYDIYVVRTNKNGEIIWQKNYGGSDWDFGYDLAFSSDGHLLICGYAENSTYGKQDAVVMKVNSADGALIWQKTFGGTGDDKLTSIFIHTNQDIYLSGSTTSYGDVNGDIYILKTNANGDSLSSIIYGGNLTDKANDIIVNSLGNIVICGGSESFSNGKMDAFFSEFSGNGQLNWKKNFGYSGFDEEAFKIVYAPTAAAGGTFISIYTTNEIASNGKDFKTIYLTYSGDFYGGGYSGSFGFSKDEETFDLIATSDKGFAQVGYTQSFGNNGSEILFVKQDSLLYRGTSIVGVQKNESRSNKISLFPNPTKLEGGKKVLKVAGSDISIIEVCVLNSVGTKILQPEIISVAKETVTFDVSELLPGCYNVWVKKEDEVVWFKLIVD